MENIRCCFNCNYFVKHYINVDGTFQQISEYGHCTNLELTRKQSDSVIENFESCIYWQKNTPQKKDIKKGIEYTLRRISKELDEVLQLLKLDKNSKE